MTWRRNENEIREVTIRHDLHALSGLFQYPATHGWAEAATAADAERLAGERARAVEDALQ